MIMMFNVYLVRSSVTGFPDNIQSLSNPGNQLVGGGPLPGKFKLFVS